MRYAPLNAQASSDAVVELILHSHCVLRASLVGAVCSVTVGDGEVGLCRLVKHIAELRTSLEEELQALAFLSPRQVGEHRQLYVVDVALIRLSHARSRINHGLVVDVENTLLPTDARIVQLGIHRAVGLEVFLAGVLERESGGEARVLRLRHLWHEAHAAHHEAAVEAERKVVAVVAHLRLCAHGCRQQQSEECFSYCLYHLFFFSLSLFLSLSVSKPL